jgi:hypothetical protein
MRTGGPSAGHPPPSQLPQQSTESHERTHSTNASAACERRGAATPPTTVRGTRTRGKQDSQCERAAHGGRETATAGGFKTKRPVTSAACNSGPHHWWAHDTARNRHTTPRPTSAMLGRLTHPLSGCTGTETDPILTDEKTRDGARSGGQGRWRGHLPPARSAAAAHCVSCCGVVSAVWCGGC